MTERNHTTYGCMDTSLGFRSISLKFEVQWVVSFVFNGEADGISSRGVEVKMPTMPSLVAR